ncbi:MAG: hypothetical protein SPD11_11515 [Sphaerochaetaceae bacterium]|nr:hypothetical protein [Sphaerochaetaceae bacterium]
MKTLKISPLYQYCLRQNLNTMAWVYGFSLGIPLILFFAILVSGTALDASGMDGSVEVATAIALFVQMIVELRNAMRLGVQNGRSRKSIVATQCLVLITAAAIYSAINVAVGLVTSALFSDYMIYTYLYRSAMTGGPLVAAVAQFLFSFAMLASVGAFGMFLSAMYWRLDKFWRVVVSIGVPGLFVFGLPTIMIRSEAGFRLGAKLIMFLGWCMGLPVQESMDVVGLNPWRPVVFLLIVAVFWLVWIYPMMREAVIKK